MLILTMVVKICARGDKDLIFGVIEIVSVTCVIPELLCSAYIIFGFLAVILNLLSKRMLHVRKVLIFIQTWHAPRLEYE